MLQVQSQYSSTSVADTNSIPPHQWLTLTNVVLHFVITSYAPSFWKLLYLQPHAQPLPGCSVGQVFNDCILIMLYICVFSGTKLYLNSHMPALVASLTLGLKCLQREPRCALNASQPPWTNVWNAAPVTASTFKPQPGKPLTSDIVTENGRWSPNTTQHHCATIKETTTLSLSKYKLTNRHLQL